MVDDRVSKKGLDSELDDLREQYNAAKRETAVLEQELRKAKESVLKYSAMYQESCEKSNLVSKEWEEKASRLQEKIDELEEENEDLRNKLQLRDEIAAKMEGESKSPLVVQSLNYLK